MAKVGKKYGYYIQSINGEEKIGIVEDTQSTVDTVTSSWSSITSEDLVARIYGSKIPTNLSLDAVDEELPLPHFVDEAALNFVIASGYEDPRNLNPQLMQMFMQKTQGLLREAKKKFRRRKQKGGYIKPYDY